jgi:hypothetical protein
MSCGFLEEIRMKNKNVIALLAVAALLAVSWVWTSVNHANTKANCVEVYVDYGILDNGKVVKDCINVSGKIDAMTVLNAAGFAIQGTDKYGLSVVCRVNSLPSGGSPILVEGHEEYIETCKDMPPAYAYWAILVRTGVTYWGWAQEGVVDIKLEPGDSIGLVFADNDNVRFPNE